MILTATAFSVSLIVSPFTSLVVIISDFVWSNVTDVNCRFNAFVCRNIIVWNRLPAHVVNSDSVAVFTL